MLGRMNFNARVDFNLSHGQSYTVPSKGYLWLYRVTGGLNSAGSGAAYINNCFLTVGRASDDTSWVRVFIPVSAGDVLTARKYDGNNASVSGFFVPQL